MDRPGGSGECCEVWGTGECEGDPRVIRCLFRDSKDGTRPPLVPPAWKAWKNPTGASRKMESEAKFEVLGERGTRVSVGWYPLSLKSGLQGRLPPGGVVLAKWKESGKRVQTGGLDDVHALTN